MQLLIDCAYIGYELNRMTYKFSKDTLQILSLGKLLGITDLRLGALILPKKVANHKETMKLLSINQNDMVISISTFEQERCLNFLEEYDKIQKNCIYDLKKLHSIFLKQLFNVDKIQKNYGGDAGIHFIQFEKSINIKLLAKKLLEKGVFIIPGEDFGVKNCIRVCIGNSTAEKIKEFANILKQIITKV